MINISVDGYVTKGNPVVDVSLNGKTEGRPYVKVNRNRGKLLSFEEGLIRLGHKQCLKLGYWYWNIHTDTTWNVPNVVTGVNIILLDLTWAFLDGEVG